MSGLQVLRQIVRAARRRRQCRCDYYRDGLRPTASKVSTPVLTIIWLALRADELHARVRALIRRRTLPPAICWHMAASPLTSPSRQASSDGTPLELAVREAGILEVLLLRAGRAVTKEQLMEACARGTVTSALNAIEAFTCTACARSWSQPVSRCALSVVPATASTSQWLMASTNPLTDMTRRPAPQPVRNESAVRLLEWLLAPLLSIWLVKPGHLFMSARTTVDTALDDGLSAVSAMLMLEWEQRATTRPDLPIPSEPTRQWMNLAPEFPVLYLIVDDAGVPVAGDDSVAVLSARDGR